MMDDAAQKPVTYIGIHERTPEVPILYISSSVRQALLFEPEECIGQSVKDFFADSGDGEGFRKELGSYSDENVIVTKVIAKRKDNTPVRIRSIAFACSNVTFHLLTAYPLAATDKHNEHISVQKFKCNLNQTNARSGEHVLYSGQGSSGAQRLAKKTTQRDVYQHVISSIRKSHQACLVLEDLKSNNTDGKPGARIIFVTDSINRILDVDACDLQEVPFLSLVALQDITKAADFLDKALCGSVLALETLRLLVNPLESSQLGSPKCVSVEFMAMGSDDGAVMLCQPKQELSYDGKDGYLSLEEIISSDPGTSDFT
ncbi:hypothetical protein GGI12_004605 [Dipsacomyces acuminosporus]|nr:hypothetical protein GGI12_004605 [Dipsacomyces acuminosporus]